MEEVHYLIPAELKIIQDNRFFKFGTDSVLLANFTEVSNGDILVDFGSGSGVIPLLLAFKQNPSRITGIEIQSKLVDLSRRSIILNNLQDKINIIEGDFKNATDYIQHGSVDQVVTNPPYMPVSAGKITADKRKAIARHEIHAELEAVVREASKILRFGGNFNIVHRSWRLAELISIMEKYNLAAKKLRFVQSRLDRGPDTFLLTAKKGAKKGLDVKPVLIVYEGQSSNYSKEVNEIYGVNDNEK